MRILVVEDEKILCDTIVRSLSRLAYSVDFCYDGGSAMELLAVENYDLVVLDLNLPDADGMTVLKTLRKNDDHTKVLILSARCDVADKVDGLDGGADDYLFAVDENLTVIRIVDSGDHVHQRCFSGAVLAENGEYLTAVDGQTYILVGDDASEAF